jgi:hypothetical protein
MKKKRLAQKQMKKRGKRILVIGCVFLTTLATLATIVSALQQHPTAAITHKIDLYRSSLSPADGECLVHRGNIYDRNFNELAVNSSTTAVYVRPLKLRDPETSAKSLAAILELEVDEIAARLKAETGFSQLAREVAPPIAAKIAALNMEGVSLAVENRRLYPNGKTGAHVVGFANSEQGLDGIEYFYDTILRKNPGPSPAVSLSLPGSGRPEDGIGDQGAHLVLTLDLRVQDLLERCLAAVIKRSAAASGSAALIAPQSGALVALANQPTFDPNRFWNFSNKDLRNRFLNDAIVPGGLESFFKQAAEFEEIKALASKRAKSAAAEPLPPNSLLILPNREKRLVADQDTVVDNEILADLFSRLHSRAAVAIDLPNLILDEPDGSGSDAANRDSATGLQLLTDFCFLVSGGRRTGPHLLRTAWDRASDRMLPLSDAATPTPEQPVIPEEEVLQVLQRLGKKGPAGGLFLESVMPCSGVGPLRETLTTGAADRAGEDRVNYQMLGLLSRDGQSLALIIAVNDADLTMLMNPAGKDSLPMTVLDHHLDRRAMQWALAPAAEPTPAMLTQLQHLLPDKLKKSSCRLPAATKADDGPGDEMPRVTGRSLRFGLQALQQFDLRVAVIGSGLIVAQKPRPGAAVRKGDPCILELATNR